ncbi:MAG: TolC family protein [Lentisphaerae bacterium]|jgi:outer membrane protein|nr:TolC family protein [Lentisphaerota bacterium]MBT4822528.1 TolC family protein [Lentisphaerota bacterium]MBT5612582.1 TolC family protein [Lentisphaerota bacterium]MBT7055684.1 TolC family protein [Lentisphaerota bacterium]MBT7845828.1 TolC family protein [Lentisphaerota bacterium]
MTHANRVPRLCTCLWAFALCVSFSVRGQSSLPPGPLELGLHQAFRLALEANKDLLVSRHALAAAEARVEAAEGEFDTIGFAESSYGMTDEPTVADPVGSADSDLGLLEAGVRKRFVTGTEVDVTGTSQYTEERSGTSALPERVRSDVSATVRQDLLRGFGSGTNRAPIVLARNNWLVSEQTLRDTAISTLFSVEQAYWDLHFAKADLQVRKTQLERAEALVSRAQSQVRVGEAAPIEVTRAQSSAAQQEVSLLFAQRTIHRVTHRLLRLLGILAPEAAFPLIETTDSPSLTPADVSLGKALATAIASRPDLAQAQLRIDSAGVREGVARNASLPEVQLYGSLHATGLDDRAGGSWDAATDGDTGAWEAGVVLEFPFRNRSARGTLRARQAETRQAEAAHAGLVETALRDVADGVADLQIARDRIGASGKARRLAATLLEAEEKSFSLGRSDSLDVLNAQAALAAAERDEIRGLVDHAIAYANLFRVQGNFLQAKGIAWDSGLGGE